MEGVKQQPPPRPTSHPPNQRTYQVEGGLLLDVVVRERAPVLQLLAREDQALLVGGDALLVLDLLLHSLDRVAGLHVERDGLARERLDEDLHAPAQAQHLIWMMVWRGEREE